MRHGVLAGSTDDVMRGTAPGAAGVDRPRRSSFEGSGSSFRFDPESQPPLLELFRMTFRQVRWLDPIRQRRQA